MIQVGTDLVLVSLKVPKPVTLDLGIHINDVLMAKATKQPKVATPVSVADRPYLKAMCVELACRNELPFGTSFRSSFIGIFKVAVVVTVIIETVDVVWILFFIRNLSMLSVLVWYGDTRN